MLPPNYWYLFWLVCHAAHGSLYDVSVEKMMRLHYRYPSRTSLETIGHNESGTPIRAIQIGKSQHRSFLVIAALHGNEPKSADFALHFAAEVLRRNRDGAGWTIIPVLNIPGFNSGSRLENGIDPNRDFPGLCDSTHSPRLQSTRHLLGLMERERFVGSAAVHGYAHAMSFPWGTSSGEIHTQDHEHFLAITEKAAAINGYPFGTSREVVYPADNTFEDFAYGKYGIWSLLLELRDGGLEDIRKSSDALLAYFTAMGNRPSSRHQFRCAPEKVSAHPTLLR